MLFKNSISWMMFFLFFFWQRTGSILFQIPLWFKVILGGCILLSLAGFRWGVYSLPGFNPFVGLGANLTTTCFSIINLFVSRKVFD